MSALPSNLTELNQRVAYDLACLAVPAKRWLPDIKIKSEPVLDVAVIGGGMAGLAVSGSLTHMGINVVTYDAMREGLEGPWAITARMRTLRSPKTLTGPAIGIPSLTFRAWFEAQFGGEEWDRLDKTPGFNGWIIYAGIAKCLGWISAIFIT